jgi:flagellar export protein FliJ
MKDFRFSLQAVLSLREESEKDAQRRYAAALAESDKALARLHAARAEVQSCWALWRNAASGCAFAADLERARMYCVLLDERQKRLEKEWKAAQLAAEQASRQLLVATQKKQVIEKLRTRKRMAHQAQVTRMEQKQQDELASRSLSLIGGGREWSSFELV